jgi:hypothetical protein
VHPDPDLVRLRPANLRCDGAIFADDVDHTALSRVEAASLERSVAREPSNVSWCRMFAIGGAIRSVV